MAARGPERLRALTAIGRRGDGRQPPEPADRINAAIYRQFFALDRVLHGSTTVHGCLARDEAQVNEDGRKLNRETTTSEMARRVPTTRKILFGF